MINGNAIALPLPRPREARAHVKFFAGLFDSPAVRVALLAMVLSHVLDLFTTAVAIQGGAAEVNPLSAMFIAAGGMGAVLAEKAVIIGITAYLMATMPVRWATTGGVMAAAVTGLAIVANLSQLGAI